MPCENISVVDDGTILCWDTKPPQEIGHAKTPPEWLSKVQEDTVNLWHRIDAVLGRMDEMFKVTVSTPANIREPHVTVNVFFAVPISEKHIKHLLDAELKMFVTDFNDRGCELKYYQPKTRMTRALNRQREPISDWEPSDHVWQVSITFPESRWGDPDIYNCLKSMVDSIRGTRLSDFLSS